MTQPYIIEPGSLLAHIKKTAPAVAASAPIASFGAPVSPPAPVAQDAAAIAAEVARLRSAEHEAKYPGLTKRLADIAACGLGMPTLAGELASAYAGLRGAVLEEGGSFPGSGELAKFIFHDPGAISDELVQQARDIQARYVAEGKMPAPPPVPVISTPVGAAPAEAPKEKKKRGRPPATPKDTAPAQAPYVPVVAGPQEVLPGTVVTSSPDTGVADAHALVLPVVSPPAPAPVIQTVPADPTPAAYTPTGINFFVDCAVDGLPTQNFWPTVYELMNVMHKQSGKTDYRLADRDSPFAFNGSKGILSSLIKQTPIPPGNYTLDGSFGDVAGIVIEAMRELVYRSGGIFIRGVR